MAVQLPAKVARTAHDLNHGNHLRIAYFGVTELRLTTAAGKSSKSYLPPGQPENATGSDDFHFAPETEPVQIFYKIQDPFGRIKKAKLELFRRNDSTVLWNKDLSADEFKDGEHKIDWDGKVEKGANFPDEYVTVEHSPYKLRIVLSGDTRGNPPTAWTYFHILVADLEFEWGAKDVLTDASNQQDKKLYDMLTKNEADPLKGGSLSGKLPASGETKEVHLGSNIFKIGSAEMENNTSYQQYRSVWADGPNIPIFAKILIKDSQDQKVEAPKAIGNTKFLWDWEDVTEDTSRHTAAAKAFIDNALNYDKSVTQPKGDNCHIDRGGKRGPAAAAIFPVQAGYPAAASLTAGSFPFKVEQCPTRKWAAFSYAWGSGAVAGKTGVLFRPARHAGDAVKLTIHLAHDRKPDGTAVIDVVNDAPLNAAIKKSTGTFQVWREVDIAAYLKKKATVTPELTIATVQNYYEKAFIRMYDLAGASAPMAKATYNTAMTTQRNNSAWYIQAAIDNSVDQYDVGDYFVHYRNHAGWKTQVDAHATANGWTNAKKSAWSQGLSNKVGNDPYANDTVYYKFLYDWALDLIPRVCDSFLSPNNGVTIFHFNNLYNPPLPRSTNLNGFAADLPSATRNKCGFIQCGSNYGGTTASGNPNLNTREQTCTHEVGHQLFLPHTWQVDATHDPQGTHDKADNACTMSYEFDKSRNFCGLCLLRLRGWSKFQTDATGAEVTPAARTLKDTGSNSKP